MSKRLISKERKSAYYIGTGIGIIGLVLFFSAFMVGLMGMGSRSMSSMQSSGQLFGFLGFSGFLLIVVGGTIANIGKQGLAGSGVVLDPEKAREDVEPWSRMQGGVIKDVLDEAGVDLSFLGKSEENDSVSEMPFDEKLRRLHALFEDGILNDEEYQREKKQLLDNN